MQVAALDDLDGPAARVGDDLRHLCSPVAGIGEDALDEGERAPCRAQQFAGAVAVLNVGGMNDDAQQEAQRVDQDVPLATLDFLARVVARRIERSPPFWAPFAVCESMMAAVGLASCPSCSRTAT